MLARLTLSDMVWDRCATTQMFTNTFLQGSDGLSDIFDAGITPTRKLVHYSCEKWLRYRILQLKTVLDLGRFVNDFDGRIFRLQQRFYFSSEDSRNFPNIGNFQKQQVLFVLQLFFFRSFIFRRGCFVCLFSDHLLLNSVKEFCGISICTEYFPQLCNILI